MLKATAEPFPFQFNVVTSSNGGHSPETIAEMCVEKLIKVSDSAPPEIAAQARAFREQMLKVVLQYVKMAAHEDRATVCAKLSEAGFGDLATQLRSL
jgi:hypothetical protein